MDMQNSTPPNVPPAEPGRDEVIIDDSQALASCVSLFEEIDKSHEWRVLTSLTTSTKKWGTVVRLDYWDHGPTLEGFVNRFMTWRSADGQTFSVDIIGLAASRANAGPT